MTGRSKGYAYVSYLAPEAAAAAAAQLNGIDFPPQSGYKLKVWGVGEGTLGTGRRGVGWEAAAEGQELPGEAAEAEGRRQRVSECRNKSDAAAAAASGRRLRVQAPRCFTAAPRPAPPPLHPPGHVC